MSTSVVPPVGGGHSARRSRARAHLLAVIAAVSIVLVQMISVSVVALILMLFGFQRYERALQSLVNFIGASKIRLMIYIALIFILPIIFIWVG